MRVLPVAQAGHAIGALAGLQQQRITTRAHKRVGRDHEMEFKSVLRAQIAYGHQHRHAGDKGFRAAARPVLRIADDIHEIMAVNLPMDSGIRWGKGLIGQSREGHSDNNTGQTQAHDHDDGPGVTGGSAT